MSQSVDTTIKQIFVAVSQANRYARRFTVFATPHRKGRRKVFLKLIASLVAIVTCLAFFSPPASGAEGACCDIGTFLGQPTGVCLILDEFICHDKRGEYLGDDTACRDCYEEDFGAGCTEFFFPGGQRCELVGPTETTSAQETCELGGRTFHGVGSLCTSVSECPPLPPDDRRIRTVTVTSTRNADDTNGYGGVDHLYRIGIFEVTAGQYTEFLNAVAGDDTYGVYDTAMADPSGILGCNIQRTGSWPNYSYSVASDWADRPVNFVSWGDAARFANWMHNGQRTGAQGLTTTEDGSYFLAGATSNADLLAVRRKCGATWVIPSEDEWYKAAYHTVFVAGNYFVYPTRGDIVPSNDLIEPDAGNNATFFDSGFTVGKPYYRTIVGAHENSESPYGTFDQGGNVSEWIEDAVLGGSNRGLRGGSFEDTSGLHAADRDSSSPVQGSSRIGFRVAMVPYPTWRPEDRDFDNDVDLDDYGFCPDRDLHGYARFQTAFTGAQ